MAISNIYSKYFLKKCLFSLVIGLSISNIFRDCIGLENDFGSIGASGPGLFAFLSVFYFVASVSNSSHHFNILNAVAFFYLGQEAISLFGLTDVFDIFDALYYFIAYSYIYIIEFRFNFKNNSRFKF
jgi:hypothetical protein